MQKIALIQNFAPEFCGTLEHYVGQWRTVSNRQLIRQNNCNYPQRKILTGLCPYLYYLVRILVNQGTEGTVRMLSYVQGGFHEGLFGDAHPGSDN